MKPTKLAEDARIKIDAAGDLAGAADWVPVMEADELVQLADRVETVAGGLVSATSRLRRLAKLKKKGGAKAVDHIKK